MQKNITELLQKEMTRKEFMATLGFGAASIFGFGTIVRMLSGDKPTAGRFAVAKQGYGSSVYGGSK